MKGLKQISHILCPLQTFYLKAEKPIFFFSCDFKRICLSDWGVFPDAPGPGGFNSTKLNQIAATGLNKAIFPFATFDFK